MFNLQSSIYEVFNLQSAAIQFSIFNLQSSIYEVFNLQSAAIQSSTFNLQYNKKFGKRFGDVK